MVDQTGQPYAYTGDDPVNSVDMLGLCPSYIPGCGTLHDIVGGLDAARHGVAAATDATKAAIGSIYSLKTQAEEQTGQEFLCDPLGTLGKTAAIFAGGALTAGVFDSLFVAGITAAPVFAGGQALETAITTSAGEVGILGDIEVDGSTLTIRNLAIYSDQGDVPNQVGASTFLSVLRQLAADATDSGFSTLRVEGERALGSSSSAPGKAVSIVIDLTKG